MLGSDGKGKNFCHKRLKVLVKVVLFQLRGRGHPQNDATPSFFLNSKSPISGLSNDISFVSYFLLEGGLNEQNKKPLI